MFLTGPNMAGKSVYLKAAGIATYLAQLGMGVPARRFRLTPFACLFSGINTTDNVRLGQSYFFAEFGAEIHGGTAAFDYRVRPGVSQQRLGMLILEREGVLTRLRQLRTPAPLS
jgi:DNA mismatch repair ATPase MutS